MALSSAPRIPQPCPESWAAMTPTATGRHCAACAKTVIDFTQLNDAEILEQLARAGRGGTCGRFRAGQLGRPLQPVALAPARGWRGWLAAAVAVWGLREVNSVAAVAQGTPMVEEPIPASVVPEQLQPTRKDDYEGVRPSQFVLEGIVLDADNKETVPGAVVRIKDTAIAVSTDLNGHFILPVPAGYAGQSVEIEFLFVGYETAARQFVWQQAGTVQCRVELKDDNIVLGETDDMVYYRTMPPAPWHPRRFYYWSKYWLTRPFRSH